MRVDRRSAYRRGYTHVWQRESRLFLAEHPWCALKGDGCDIVATVVDHIIPHKGDMERFWNRANWQPLCKHCHDAHKQRIEAGGMLHARRNHKGRLI